MSFFSLLDRYGTLSRQNVTKGTSGETIKAFAPILSQVRLAVIPAGGQVQNNYAVRKQVVTHKIITTFNLDSAVALGGQGALGGAKLGDQWFDGTNTYLVQDYYVEGNRAICPESLYVSVCQLIRP